MLDNRFIILGVSWHSYHIITHFITQDHALLCDIYFGVKPRKAFPPDCQSENSGLETPLLSLPPLPELGHQYDLSTDIDNFASASKKKTKTASPPLKVNNFITRCVLLWSLCHLILEETRKNHWLRLGLGRPR